MRNTYQQILKHDFPRFFRLLNDKDQPKPQWSISMYGMECSDGWYEIIRQAASQIESLNTDVYAQQIKEKFGGLRIYTNITTPEVSEIISKAEMAAEITCEKCGNSGYLMSHRRMETLCQPCFNTIQTKILNDI